MSKRHLEAIKRGVERDGRVWVVGEMEFDANNGPIVAAQQAGKVAEACGFLVWPHYGPSAFAVTGPGIIGYYVFDWFRVDAQRLQKIEHWTSEVVYMEEEKCLTKS